MCPRIVRSLILHDIILHIIPKHWLFDFCKSQFLQVDLMPGPGFPRAPDFHQLPKRLCAFARVAVRWAAWAACAAARPAPAGSRPRAGALAGRPGRGPLLGLGAAPWETSNMIKHVVLTMFITMVEPQHLAVHEITNSILMSKSLT